MDIFLQLTLVGEDVGDTFSLFSNVDGFTTAFETGVSKTSLLAGYTTVAPALTNVVHIQSTDGVCDNNYVVILLLEPIPTTTTTTTAPIVLDWYELTNCATSAITFSISYPEGTFALDDRVTSGEVTYHITDIVHANPGGDLISITTTGQTGCPTTTTTTTAAPVTYYELAGCLPADYAFTAIAPTLGTGQQYILPGLTPIYYTYTGFSETLSTPPGYYNASIQAGITTGCP